MNRWTRMGLCSDDHTSAAPQLKWAVGERAKYGVGTPN